MGEMKKRMTGFKLTILLLLCALGTQQAWAAFVGPRSDFRDESIYFVITTRFYDGDPGNPTTATPAGEATSRV